MDRLSDSFRLIYYDQRGRGKSAAHVQPEDVSLASEMQDVESVRAFFRLESAVVLGHSFGGLLAMEYALRHPDRVSHLILMNTAPASYDGFPPHIHILVHFGGYEDLLARYLVPRGERTGSGGRSLRLVRGGAHRPPSLALG